MTSSDFREFSVRNRSARQATLLSRCHSLRRKLQLCTRFTYKSQSSGKSIKESSSLMKSAVRKSKRITSYDHERAANHRVNRAAGKRCLPVRFGLRPAPADYAER